jgi:enamine deaminase RidA (YjgF/YER057c/UK114 family)
MSAVSLIRSDALADVAPYAYASLVSGGARLVFTAGACPLDPSGKVVPEHDIPGQATRVMDNLETALEAAGARLTDVAKTTVYVASTERADLVAAWDVVSTRFGTHDAGQLVEVEAVAVLG